MHHIYDCYLDTEDEICEYRKTRLYIEATMMQLLIAGKTFEEITALANPINLKPT